MAPGEGAVLAGALLAVLAAWPATTHAQVLVSNMSKEDTIHVQYPRAGSENELLGGGYLIPFTEYQWGKPFVGWVAQDFVTGPNPAGYRFESAVVNVESMVDSATFNAYLYTAQYLSNREEYLPFKPMAKLDPRSIQKGRVYLDARAVDGEYPVLDPNRRYFVFMRVILSRVTFRWTSSNAEDAGGAPGWSIDDTSVSAVYAWPDYHWKDRYQWYDPSLKIEIHGAAVMGGAEDTTAPTVAAATVDQAALVLTYDESLDEASTPEADAFTVTVAGSARALATTDPVAVSGQTVTLRLFSEVERGETVTLDYTVPTGTDANPIQDIAGNEAAALSSRQVSNVTAVKSPSLSVADAEGTEGTDSGITFTVSLAPAATAQVTVDYATSAGTATAGADYVATSGTLTFAPGETEKSVSVPINDDEEEDGGETFTLTLSNPSGARIDDAEATGTILNSETGAPDPLTALFDSVPASHDGEAFTFTLRFSEDVGELSYETLRDEAFEMTGGAVQAVSRQQQGSNRAWNITVEPSGDDDVTITLPETTDCDASGAICTEDGRPLSHALSETVTGPVIVPALSVSDASATEGEAVEFTVSLSAESAQQVTVGYATSGGTATSGTDFTAASGTLAFAASETSKTVSVATTDDSDDEGDETFTLTLSSPAHATLGDGAATGEIIDNDVSATPLTASFSDMPSSHTGAAFTFGLEFSEEVELSYVTLRDDALEMTGGAVQAVSRQQQGSNRAWNVTVEPSGDDDVTITLPETTDCDASGAICTEDGRPLSHALSETVTGPVIVPALSVSDASATEGEAVEFTVSLSATSSQQVTVGYATSGGTATSGTDFTAASGTLVFAASETSKTVSVATTDDSDDEGDETFTLTLSSPANATLGDGAATGEILDDDEDEGVSALTASFSDMPSSHTGAAFTFGLEFSEEVELSYVTLRDDALEMTGGAVQAVSRKQQGSDRAWNVTVEPSGDDDVTITLPETTDCDASGAICTEDGRPLSHALSETVTGPVIVPALSVSDASATEGEAVEFTVSLSATSSQQVTVGYATSGGTATSGTDFTAASGTLVFAASETSKTVSVATTDDSDDEGDETFTLTLSSPANATLGDGAATGEILDDDEDEGVSALTASFSEMPSSHTGAEFTFGLVFSEEVSLSYETLRDDAFAVTGGEVRKAKRLQQGSNMAWNITVGPTSATDTVKITLPETTDCNAGGAICTEDGRPLSHSLSARVEPAASASANDAGGGDVVDDALALLGGVTPDEASAALFGEGGLSEAQLEALDRLGNRNGRYDLGDLLSWRDRCRTDEAPCGGTSSDPGPASSALLFGAAAAGRRRTSGRTNRRGSGRRRARGAACRVAVLLAAVTAWSCTGDLVGPPAAEPDPGAPAVERPVPATAAPQGPGFLTVEWTAPAASRAVGVLLELEGPGIEAVQAPGLELYQSGAAGRHQLVVAGSLDAGPIVRFRVPDRARLAEYRVRVLQVTGEDYGLRDVGAYRAVITSNWSFG